MTPEQEARRIRARRLHGEGWTFAAIAREIGVSPPTVRKYCRGLGLPDNQDSRRGRAESVRSPRNNELAQLPEREAAFDMILAGKSVLVAARTLGRDHRTVQRWINEEIESRVGPRVEKLRVLANARLDAMRVIAWEIMESADNPPKVRLEAMDRCVNIERRAAAVNGWDSPVRVDAVLTEQTEADREFVEMMNELRARNAVIEGEILGDQRP